MRDWTLSRIVWVADRGFSSRANRRYLRQGDHAYIIGEKLRSGSPEIKAALSRQGRYTAIAENMQVKEVKVADTERFVICHNPDAATRDAHIRAQLVAQLDELIAGSDTLPADEARRAARADLHQARPEPVPARHPRRAAAHRQGQMQDRGQPRRQVPAALLGPAPVGRRHRPGLQAAPRSRTRLARHEADPRPAPGLPPPRRTHPRPRPAVLARAAAHPHRRDHHRRHLAHTCAATSTGSTPAPSPAPPAPSASAPSSPSPNATCSPGSTSPPPRRSCRRAVRRHPRAVDRAVRDAGLAAPAWVGKTSAANGGSPQFRYAGNRSRCAA